MPTKIGWCLRILCGCHARPDRSFFYKGRQFPVCARCTGEYVGLVLGIPIAFIFGVPKIPIALLMMIPMVFDGFLQLLTSYESGNMRRLFTGILFGMALLFMLIYLHCASVRMAGHVLKLFMDDPAKIDRLVEMLT